MTNKVQQFQNEEFGNIEILMIDEKPHFPATECAKILGYSRPENAILRHCKGSLKQGVLTNGGNQEKTFIPEGDLYRLIIRSKLPAAERFERWVFDEVLPSIRKYGAYATSNTLDEILRDPKFAEALIKKLDKERKKNAALEELAEELAPKAIYCDLILQSKNLVPVSLISKDYGMSASSFNNLLHALGIQYRTGGTWLLYQRYSGKGYTKTRTYVVNERVSSVNTYWTQKGRLFLYELLGSCGIFPLADIARGQ